MLSIVIPVFDEAESLRALHEELEQVLGNLELEAEMIFVDDGSTDGSWEVIAQLQASDARVRGIRFRRNFGKAAALNAGITAARGEWIVTMDADLQDDPAEIPRFLEAIQREGWDVVSGWKRVRHDPWHKVWPSRIFNLMVSRLTGVRLHDHNCGFKIYRREVFERIVLYGERHRFIPVLAAAWGWKVGEIEVHHRPRRYGRSKYGVWRMVKGFLDLLTIYFLTGYGQRPQHLLGSIGLFCLGLGTLVLAVLTVLWGVTRWDNLSAWMSGEAGSTALEAARANDLHLHSRALFYYAIVAILLGTQLTALGFLAELLTAQRAGEEPPYLVSECIGSEPASDEERQDEESS